MVFTQRSGITQYIVQGDLVVLVVAIGRRKIGRVWLEGHLRIGGKVIPYTSIRIGSCSVLILAHLVVETRFK